MRHPLKLKGIGEPVGSCNFAGNKAGANYLVDLLLSPANRKNYIFLGKRMSKNTNSDQLKPSIGSFLFKSKALKRAIAYIDTKAKQFKCYITSGSRLDFVGLLSIVLFLTLITYICTFPSYEYSVSGVHNGAGLELKLWKTTRQGKRISGTYNGVEVSEDFPYEKACVSEISFIREGGTLMYGEIPESAMEEMAKLQLDQCVIDIVDYIDSSFPDVLDEIEQQNSNRRTYE